MISCIRPVRLTRIPLPNYYLRAYAANFFVGISLIFLLIEIVHILFLDIVRVPIYTIDMSDVRVFHDPKWTTEALFNIWDNAVKYTASGSIQTLLS